MVIVSHSNDCDEITIYLHKTELVYIGRRRTASFNENEKKKKKKKKKKKFI